MYCSKCGKQIEDGTRFCPNCGKFRSGDDYCKFTYDLSEFDGQDVMICISVHNGEKNGDENKLTLNAIDIE